MSQKSENRIIRDAAVADAAAICEIYNHYIQNTIITFEEQSVSADQMAQRIAAVTASYPWLVSAENGQVLGYAYVDRWRPRSAYRHSVESTVYVRSDATGKGIGKPLLKALLDRIRQTSIHSILAAIALPNEPSIVLHEQFGFRQVGCFRQTGRKFDQWIDVGYWQLVLPDSKK